MEKLAVLTSGGDASGMNAAIRAVVRTGICYGMEVYGVKRGYEGLIDAEFVKMHAGSVADIIHRGGTILQTSRSDRFMTEAGRLKAKENMEQLGIRNLVVIGGNGTLTGGYLFSGLGINVIGIPATIDNDVPYTRSIGFDTAVNTVLEAVNRIRDTATSHGRVFIIEVMGRECGELAVAAGLAGGAEALVIPEMETDMDKIAVKINKGAERGKLHSIIIAVEGVYPLISLKEELEKRTGREVRVTILGHIQRGGIPTAADRILASLMGKAAVDSIAEGKRNVMAISSADEAIQDVPLAQVVDKGVKKVDLNRLYIADVLSI